MTMLRVWHGLSYIGDGAVLMPCAVLLFAWLIATPATRRSGWWWAVAVLLVGGGVALSKVLYMVSGWQPAGWDFIGLSGHAALSFLFFPCAGALVATRNRTGLRVAAVALGAGLALAICASSWVLRDHSLSEVVVGALWGAAVATAFLILTWRQVAQAPLMRNWIIASVMLLMLFAFGHEFPSQCVVSRIALQVAGHTPLHTRGNLGAQARLPGNGTDRRHADSTAARTHPPQQQTP